VTNKFWIKETARDIIALGSIVFYFLVVGRALVGPFWIFFTFLCSAAAALLIIYFLHKEFETYIARGIILAIGTSYFYSDLIFTLFAAVVYILMVVSSSLLGNSIKKIVKGIIFGLISTGVGYLAAELFFERPWY
jgi:hypothetical protein